MNDTHTELPISEDTLLKNFKRGDYERARDSVLERYRLWQGILVSNNEQTVITPDDLNHFRVQAADLMEQELKSEYEWEQLKILTVLIYILMDAEKTALPGDNPDIQEQLEQRNLPHAADFIMRRISHGAGDLDYADIERFARYENLVLSSYITSISPEEANRKAAVEGLISRDGVHFDLVDTAHEVTLKRRADEAAPAEPAAGAEAAAPEPVTELEPIIIVDNSAPYLVNTLQYTTLRCGAEVTSASYVGKAREHNEDAVVVQPENNQVVVIDAMGGYGNGVTARDVFVDMLLQNPSDMEATVSATQQRYDDIGLEQGGVCIIEGLIAAVDDGFRINLSQAGDVHALLFDQKDELKHETVDEAIGHQVINAIIGAYATRIQRENGWNSFGQLTRATLRAKKGWRLAIYSDGIANHFNAEEMAEFITNRTAKQAIAAISRAVDIEMGKEKAYRDNSSIAIVDF